jgi:hypothetical protein
MLPFFARFNCVFLQYSCSNEIKGYRWIKLFVKTQSRPTDEYDEGSCELLRIPMDRPNDTLGNAGESQL